MDGMFPEKLVEILASPREHRGVQEASGGQGWACIKETNSLPLYYVFADAGPNIP